MSYKITIIEKKTVRQVISTTWGTVGYKEVERESRFYSGASNEGEPKTRIEEVRGYLPPVEQDVKLEREVLTQEVEELDLAAVIKAINKL